MSEPAFGRCSPCARSEESIRPIGLDVLLGSRPAAAGCVCPESAPLNRAHEAMTEAPFTAAIPM